MLNVENERRVCSVIHVAISENRVADRAFVHGRRLFTALEDRVHPFIHPFQLEGSSVGSSFAETNINSIPTFEIRPLPFGGGRDIVIIGAGSRQCCVRASEPVELGEQIVFGRGFF